MLDQDLRGRRLDSSQKLMCPTLTEFQPIICPSLLQNGFPHMNVGTRQGREGVAKGRLEGVVVVVVNVFTPTNASGFESQSFQHL